MKRVCYVCGCDDEHACITPEGPCSWILDNLCSACVVHVPEKRLLIPKTCAFCTNLACSTDGFFLHGRKIWTCQLGRFDGNPKPGEFRAEGYHHWYFWSGIWKPNKAVRLALYKCPHFAVCDQVEKVSRRGRQ